MVDGSQVWALANLRAASCLRRLCGCWPWVTLCCVLIPIVSHVNCCCCLPPERRSGWSRVRGGDGKPVFSPRRHSSEGLGATGPGFSACAGWAPERCWILGAMTSSTSCCCCRCGGIACAGRLAAGSCCWPGCAAVWWTSARCCCIVRTAGAGGGCREQRDTKGMHSEVLMCV